MYIQSYLKNQTDILVIMDYPSFNDLSSETLEHSHCIAFLKRHLGGQGADTNRISFYQFFDYNLSQVERDAIEVTTKRNQKEALRLPGGYIKMEFKHFVDKMFAAIAEAKPAVILCMSNTALMALCPSKGLWAWRGSQLWSDVAQCNVLPTYDLFSVYKMQELQMSFSADTFRCVKGTKESWQFFADKFNITINPTFKQVEDFFEELLSDLDSLFSPVYFSVDTETRSSKYISIFGIGLSETEAFVIPFITADGTNYWETLEQEFKIVKWILEFVKHKKAKHIYQNGVYDAQYVARLWGHVPKIDLDTMVECHMQFTKGQKLGLSFIASLFCGDYRYWKEDGKNFHESFQTKADFDTYQRYNGYDCCYTYEAGVTLLDIVPKNVHPFPIAFQRRMQNAVVIPGLEGVRFDAKKRLKWYFEHNTLLRQYEAWFQYMIPDECVQKNGKSPWWNSPTKLACLLYEQFKLNVIFDKKTKSPTTNDAALAALASEEPILKLVLLKLQEYRGIKKIHDSYLSAVVSQDGRIRTQYSLPGTDTFRLASKVDGFGEGLNFQNITKG